MCFSTTHETADIHYFCLKKFIVLEYKSTDLFINCSKRSDCSMYCEI